MWGCGDFSHQSSPASPLVLFFPTSSQKWVSSVQDWFAFAYKSLHYQKRLWYRATIVIWGKDKNGQGRTGDVWQWTSNVTQGTLPDPSWMQIKVKPTTSIISVCPSEQSRRIQFCTDLLKRYSRQRQTLPLMSPVEVCLLQRLSASSHSFVERDGSASGKSATEIQNDYTHNWPQFKQ